MAKSDSWKKTKNDAGDSVYECVHCGAQVDSETRIAVHVEAFHPGELSATETKVVDKARKEAADAGAAAQEAQAEADRLAEEAGQAPGAVLPSAPSETT